MTFRVAVRPCATLSAGRSAVGWPPTTERPFFLDNTNRTAYTVDMVCKMEGCPDLHLGEEGGGALEPGPVVGAGHAPRMQQEV